MDTPAFRRPIQQACIGEFERFRIFVIARASHHTRTVAQVRVSRRAVSASFSSLITWPTLHIVEHVVVATAKQLHHVLVVQGVVS